MRERVETKVRTKDGRTGSINNLSPDIVQMMLQWEEAEIATVEIEMFDEECGFFCISLNQIEEILSR